MFGKNHRKCLFIVPDIGREPEDCELNVLVIMLAGKDGSDLQNGRVILYSPYRSQDFCRPQAFTHRVIEDITNKQRKYCYLVFFGCKGFSMIAELSIIPHQYPTHL